MYGVCLQVIEFRFTLCLTCLTMSYTQIQVIYLFFNARAVCMCCSVCRRLDARADELSIDITKGQALGESAYITTFTLSPLLGTSMLFTH